MPEQVWLDLPCASCGEFALEADIVMRDVTLRLRPLEGGRLAVDVVNADAHVAAAACHACGEEPDPTGDDDVTEALEAAAEAWLARLADDGV